MLRVHPISGLYLSTIIVFIEYQLRYYWLICNFLQRPVAFCLPGSRFCYASVQFHDRTFSTEPGL